MLLLFAIINIKQEMTAVNTIFGYTEENMRNKGIREAAKNRGVRLWQIAERLGMNDGNFSRKLRRELPTEEREKIIEIIDELAKEKEDR